MNSTTEKLEHSRREFARVQSELMVSRREVEAHVIAMEKQRLTTSKAMDDMAAERKAIEETAKKRLNELRGELETKEKQALDASEEMSKDYELKIRFVNQKATWGPSRVLCRLCEKILRGNSAGIIYISHFY